jgi:hypothetical protein
LRLTAAGVSNFQSSHKLFLQLRKPNQILQGKPTFSIAVSARNSPFNSRFDIASRRR